MERWHNIANSNNTLRKGPDFDKKTPKKTKNSSPTRSLLETEKLRIERSCTYMGGALYFGPDQGLINVDNSKRNHVLIIAVQKTHNFPTALGRGHMYEFHLRYGLT